MKRLLLASLTLCVLFVSVRAVPTGLSATIGVDPVTITLGQSIHLTGTVTNDGNRDLVLYHTQLYAYRNVAGCTPFYLLQNDVPIAAGQTITVAVDYTPDCIGVWEAAMAVQPKKLVSGQQYLIAEMEYTVQ
jgi:hypothetical protein